MENNDDDDNDILIHIGNTNITNFCDHNNNSKPNVSAIITKNNCDYNVQEKSHIINKGNDLYKILKQLPQLQQPSIHPSFFILCIMVDPIGKQLF